MYPHSALQRRLRARIARLVFVIGAGAAATACDSAEAPPAEGVNAPDEATPIAAEGAAAVEAEPPAGEADASAEGAETPTGEPAVEAVEATDPTPKVRTGTADDPLRVLMIGDSMIATGLGVLVERSLDEREDIVAYRKGKSSSGLARPDFFDWMDQAKANIDWRKPEVVVVMIGGNDGQDLTSAGGGNTGRVRWDSEAWATAYRERVDAFLAEVAGEERHVIWLGLPTMGMRSLEKKLVGIRQIQREAVEAFGPRAHYVETEPFLVDEAGELLNFGEVKGKRREIRESDGIHFTMHGAEYLADRLLAPLLNEVGIEAVPDAVPAATGAETAPADGAPAAATGATGAAESD